MEAPLTSDLEFQVIKSRLRKHEADISSIRTLLQLDLQDQTPMLDIVTKLHSDFETVKGRVSLLDEIHKLLGSTDEHVLKRLQDALSQLSDVKTARGAAMPKFDAIGLEYSPNELTTSQAIDKINTTLDERTASVDEFKLAMATALNCNVDGDLVDIATQRLARISQLEQEIRVIRIALDIDSTNQTATFDVINRNQSQLLETQTRLFNLRNDIHRAIPYATGDALVDVKNLVLTVQSTHNALTEHLQEVNLGYNPPISISGALDLICSHHKNAHQLLKSLRAAVPSIPNGHLLGDVKHLVNRAGDLPQKLSLNRQTMTSSLQRHELPFFSDTTVDKFMTRFEEQLRTADEEVNAMSELRDNLDIGPEDVVLQTVTDLVHDVKKKNTLLQLLGLYLQQTIDKEDTRVPTLEKLNCLYSENASMSDGPTYDLPNVTNWSLECQAPLANEHEHDFDNLARRFQVVLAFEMNAKLGVQLLESMIARIAECQLVHVDLLSHTLRKSWSDEAFVQNDFSFALLEARLVEFFIRAAKQLDFKSNRITDLAELWLTRNPRAGSQLLLAAYQTYFKFLVRADRDQNLPEILVSLAESFPDRISWARDSEDQSRRLMTDGGIRYCLLVDGHHVGMYAYDELVYDVALGRITFPPRRLNGVASEAIFSDSGRGRFVLDRMPQVFDRAMEVRRAARR